MLIDAQKFCFNPVNAKKVSGTNIKERVHSSEYE